MRNISGFSSFTEEDWVELEKMKRLKFPLPLEKALRVWMPNRKHSDRRPLYLEYLRTNLHYDGFHAPNDVPRVATEKEITSVLERKANGWFTRERFQSATEELFALATVRPKLTTGK